MTNLTNLFASLVLASGLVATSNAASVISAVDGFKVYQSDTEEATDGADGEEKKKVEGEEEEPDC
jgi:hypothetical protein